MSGNKEILNLIIILTILSGGLILTWLTRVKLKRETKGRDNGKVDNSSRKYRIKPVRILIFILVTSICSVLLYRYQPDSNLTQVMPEVAPSKIIQYGIYDEQEKLTWIPEQEKDANLIQFIEKAKDELPKKSLVIATWHADTFTARNSIIYLPKPDSNKAFYAEKLSHTMLPDNSGCISFACFPLEQILKNKLKLGLIYPCGDWRVVSKGNIGAFKKELYRSSTVIKEYGGVDLQCPLGEKYENGSYFLIISSMNKQNIQYFYTVSLFTEDEKEHLPEESYLYNDYESFRNELYWSIPFYTISKYLVKECTTRKITRQLSLPKTGSVAENIK